MIERLAFWCALLQLPIYIAQKDANGALGWSQTDKGVVFFWWALVQNISPVFAGGFADKYGPRRTFAFAFVLIILGYSILATQREFMPFLAGALILGLGSGIFKPAMQGEIARSIEGERQTVGWGIYVMLINIAVFLGPPVAIFLKGISWSAVFFGCATIMALNFLILPAVASDGIRKKSDSALEILKKTFSGITNILPFILLMSGFTIIYMQFYETLPNFIYDWSDTSAVARSLPGFMTMETARGTMIAYEWLYNLNSGIIILSIVWLSWIFSKYNILNMITFGILIAAAGLALAGSAIGGGWLMVGFIIYTIGEMLTNPRFNEYMGIIAPDKDKSLYMSWLNIAWAIGLGGGSLLGGYLYKNLGEKSGFAMDYIASKYPEIKDITHYNAVDKLVEIESLTHTEVTHLLWETYDPWMVWMPFVAIGIVSAFGIYVYSKKKSFDNI